MSVLPVTLAPDMLDAVLLARLALCFTAYSLAGWAYETVFCSVVEGRRVSRGFLTGPFCPIYGTGAIAVCLCLGWVGDPILTFVLGAGIATAIEFVTGWALERAFHRTWWDYSWAPGNVQGRICPFASLAFGCFSVAAVFWIQPTMLGLLDGFDAVGTLQLASLAVATLTLDLALSCVKLTNMDTARRTVSAFARRITIIRLG